MISRAMTSNQNRGALIVIEGADRTGKSTQSKMLVDALLAEGKQAELVKFPGTLPSSSYVCNLPYHFINNNNVAQLPDQ